MKKLFAVIRQGKLDEVKAIIEKKPELVNCVSGPLPKKDHGQSPLQVALKTGNYEIADYLISHGADINFMEAEDDDPGLRAPVLFDAINSTISSLCYGRFEESDIAFEYVKLLVEKGADVNKLASNGFDAINWSVSCAELLFERASIYSNAQDAVRRQLTKILDLLIENGADYVAWAHRGHYAEPYPGPSNKSMYIDEFVPGDETDTDKNKELRAFMQAYFKSRNLQVKVDDVDKLIKFRLEANVNTYAALLNEVVSTRMNSRDFHYESGEYVYHDTYVGGEQFAGQEAIWKAGTAVYAMNYIGRVLNEGFSVNFLKEALKAADEKNPYRGSDYYQSGNYVYKSNVAGTIDWFQGYEEMWCEETKVYECYFHGGLMK